MNDIRESSADVEPGLTSSELSAAYWGVVMLLATFVLRMMVVEATANRFGVFGHAFAGGLVLLLLAAVYFLSGPVVSATGGPAP